MAPPSFNTVTRSNPSSSSHPSGNTSLFTGTRQGRGQGGVFKRPHRKILRDNIQGLTKPAIRRLARRGGVKSIKYEVYDATREAVVTYLKEVICRTALVLESSNSNINLLSKIDERGRPIPAAKERKAVTSLDVVYALNSMGRTFWGFGTVSGLGFGKKK